MTLKKLCPRCNKLIDAGKRYCDECQKKYERTCKRCSKTVEQGQRYCSECKKYFNERDKEHHREYKKNRTDIKEQRLYTSRDWGRIKQHIKSKYNGLCLWSYYNDNRIVSMDVVHHIVPVKDDWGMRLDIYNLIPLSNRAHIHIHKLYDNDKLGTQKILKDLLFKWNKLEKL